ncbi:3-dehydroquinate synthase, chloroplastic-like isoform X3 [Gossypium arboreum]|uniref:3-dehydroquinate synthase, chloroplastic-like isoform X3 n=1 Tax=Gossypium arboreum TaxID=29729 RepID=UPI00081922F7|nr:3-dehydroquinate synthase, chloroplastic-like isoform X3 [Gossypium arboreum]
MASISNAFSLSLPSNRIANSSSDFNPITSALSLRVNKPAKVSLFGLDSGEFSPGRVAVSKPSGIGGRICANATPVMDQPVGEKSSGAPTIVEVDLGNRSYPIYIGSGLLDQPELLQNFDRHVHGKKVIVVTNTTIAPLYLDKVVEALTKGNTAVSVEYVILPDGEKFKDMDTLMKVFDKANESRLDRRCTFVALGGGVIGDMCGFAAASFLRSVNFIQIPTTVMAQVDSSVGGKTGINHPLGKNLIGAFYQPQCVLIDTDTLDTLPDRELASGLAEVIKYGLIRDAEFFEWQEKNMEKLIARNPNALAYAIKRSCENKAEVVSFDEKESGLRATLNLGHTFGHTIETGFGYGQWLHGEAVAAGTVMAVDMSYRLGWIDSSIVKRVDDILLRAKLPTAPPETMTVEMFKSVMAVDKKVADGLLRLILLKGPLGNCVFTGEYDRKALDDTLSAFCKS